MKELEILLGDLNKHFETASTAIRQTPSYNAHVEGNLSLRKNEVDSFGKNIKAVDLNPALKSEILKNFKIEYDRIKTNIDKIQ